MPSRLRLFDVQLSELPGAIGLCSSDTAGIARVVNIIQQRLLYCKEAGEESWNGTWAEILFTLSRDTPYATFGRDIARLELVDVCNRPVEVNNQFQEYLRFGNGRMPNLFRRSNCNCFKPEVFARDSSPTFVDLSPAPQFLRAYYTDASDIGKRVMISGLDNNNNIIYSQDGRSRAEGMFANLTTPFVQWPMLFNKITGIQKDVTNFPVQIMQVDPTTGAQVLLVTMQPTEKVAWYRRYFFNNLPFNCCTFTGPNPCSPVQPASSVQITAIAKLEFIPVVAQSDYLMIGNIPALIEEAMAWRYSSMDSAASKQLEAIKHRNAVRYLNGELSHYQGKDNPAVNLAVFGSARLSKQGIGTMV